jgi:hypothetical protein
MSYRTRLILTLTFLLLTLAGGVVVASRQVSDQYNRTRGSGGVRKAPAQLELVALATVAKRTGSAPSDLQITASTTLDLPVSAEVAHQFSIRNKRTGTLHEVVLDAGGIELDRDQLLRDEKAAYTAKYGKLDKALAERLDKGDQSELVLVQIQVFEPDDEDLLPKQLPMTSEAWAKMSETEKKAFEEQEEATVQQRRKLVAARAQQIIGPIVKRLADANYECKTDESAPVVYVRLTRGMIKEVETWPEVERISLVGTSQNSLDVSRRTTP